MTAERRPVCYRCAQIKQACDGNLPCSRCTRLSLPCRPRNAVDDGLAAPGNEDLDTPKARIRRVQTGCLMCKQRKKKCDEIKPKCGDCRRLCLDCHWPPERSKDKVTAKMDRQLNDAGKTQLADEKRHHHRPQHTTQRNGAPATPSATVSPIPSTMPAETTAPSTAPFGQVPIRQTSPVLSSPVSVKRESPVGSGSSASSESSGGNEFIADMYGCGVVNTWEQTSTAPSWYGMISPNSNNASPGSYETTPFAFYVPHLLPQLTSPHDRALLNHYSTIVSPLLSRGSTSSSNPYIHYLLPMASSNELVLHCLLALSGNHWRKMQPNMGNRGLLHQGRATHSLACLLPHVDKASADIALVSSLLLCMTELFDGTSEGWKLHLRGAKRLLAALRQQYGDLSTGHYKFLVRLSRFLDSAATVSTCRPPLMEEEAREEATIEGMVPTADADDSAVYGIPRELFHLVDQINILADKRKTRVDAASEAIFRAEASDVEERINQWPCKYGGVDGAIMTLSPTDRQDALHATVAFEHALRLRLHQVVEGYELNNPRVVQAVEGILDSVQKIRYGSPLEPCLLFPLVMAGGACYRLEQRAIIQDRLMVMERTCGFGYVYNARDLVERVWTRRDHPDDSGEVVNWAKIRYEEMHGLVVF